MNDTSQDMTPASDGALDAPRFPTSSGAATFAVEEPFMRSAGADHPAVEDAAVERAPVEHSTAEQALVKHSPVEAASQNGSPGTTRPNAPRRGRTKSGAPPTAGAPQPVLEQLAQFYPMLFGANFLPLKRGIFQDLMAAHPGVFEREALKGALGFHTRSTRYLIEVAAGRKRHDLQVQAVEDMAPEHVYQALVEVFRRRQRRVGEEDLRPKLQRRIVQAFDASGLSKDAYAELVRSRDEAANAVLDDALAEIGLRDAKDEALLRAFTASGQTIEAFADMYGMPNSVAAAALERARRHLPSS